MNRSSLTFQTVYFHPSDREDAVRLGSDLYERVTRPADDPLAYGPSIPVLVGVSWDAVDTAVADTIVLTPVLGSASYQTMADDVLRTLSEWHEKLSPGHVLPVPTSSVWRGRESELPGKLLLTALYGKGDARRQTIDEILLGTSRLWGHDRKNVQLFISHAKADLTGTDEAAKKIHDFVVTDTTGKAFFDATDLRPGESLNEQLLGSLQDGVLITVRGDAYSSRVWCQRELLKAKLNGLPTLTVEVLRQGEPRAFPYAGNSPSVVWNGQPGRIVSLAIVEWLRDRFFKREAKRIGNVANLPEDVAVRSRAPELLDFTEGPLKAERPLLVLHPDPELSVLERQLLKSARPRLRLATPTTVFRRLLSRQEEAADVSSPLEGMQVAMSLSSSPDVDGAAGFTERHVVDATVSIARALISAGAAIAYGGDFRGGGYTPLLALLIQAYNQTASKRAHDLHSYLAAPIALGEAGDLPLQMHHLLESPDMAKDAILPRPVSADIPSALYFSDMRRVMEKHIHARVVLGGNTQARTESTPKGYGGRYPGVIEECWRSLQAGNPLYLAGGFGGAAGIVADLLEGLPISDALNDAIWLRSEMYAKNARALDAHHARRELGLPERMADLAAEIGKYSYHLRNDESAILWNGLSREENLQLFRTRDPVILTCLISKGLLRFARYRSADQLQIELVHDNLAAADKLDVIAIATIDGVPLSGAGAALDLLTGGAASDAHARRRTLVSLKESHIDANWLYLASLGTLAGANVISIAIEKAAADTAEQAARFGFQRVGVVSFGGNVLPDTGQVAEAMLKGFLRKKENLPILVWYETNEQRFDALRDTFAKDPSVKLTTRRGLARAAKEISGNDPFILAVQLADGQLSATCLPPSSAAAVLTRQSPLPSAELAELTEGGGPDGRMTPGFDMLQEKGERLGRLLFGPDAASILEQCRDSRLIVVHDLEAAKLPFETLLAGQVSSRELAGGLTRRLAVPGLAFERQFAQPRKLGRLTVLLIANPTRDLPGAAREAQILQTLLSQQIEHVLLEELWEDAATPTNVAAALARADVVHYCGHAFFNGPGENESGLLLAGRITFTGQDLRAVGQLPRVAFVNACEAGKVRGAGPKTEATAFAEFFLRSGVEAYVGTYWEVVDAAALFATTVYTHIAVGEVLEEAVHRARKALFEKREPDWANYLLFGGGRFQLISER